MKQSSKLEESKSSIYKHSKAKISAQKTDVHQSNKDLKNNSFEAAMLEGMEGNGNQSADVFA